MRHVGIVDAEKSPQAREGEQAKATHKRMPQRRTRSRLQGTFLHDVSRETEQRGDPDARSGGGLVRGALERRRRRRRGRGGAGRGAGRSGSGAHGGAVDRDGQRGRGDGHDDGERGGDFGGDDDGDRGDDGGGGPG